MSTAPNGCCHPPADHSRHVEHTQAAEAADRVSAWLTANWKYVSDDLGHDLRLLIAAASDNRCPPGQAGE